MKTLIIYASKNGATKHCAELLKNEIGGETALINVKKMNPKILAEYDNIVVGSPIYIGKIRREMSKFLTLNQANLNTKPLSIFLVCGFKDPSVLETNFPKSVLSHAKATAFLGHEYHLDKMNFMDRFIVKRTRSEEDLKKASLNPKAIHQFAENIKPKGNH